MSTSREPTSLEQLLDRLGEAAQERDRVSLDAVLRVVGRRSFGVLLLAAGLITLAPLIGDIPGVPTVMGLFVVLIALQLLLGRERFWLPGWLLGRSVRADHLRRALVWMRRPARFVDRFLRPRLTFLTAGPAAYAIAAMCILIAAVMPVMEFVPFSANAAGVALTSFGLSLIVRDGLLAMLASGCVLVTVGLMAYHLV